MSKKQNNDENGPSTKKKKLSDEGNDAVELATVAVNEEPRSPDIFKLTIDCFEEVFDFLSLEHLTAIGRTCKRMQKIAGHCFQQNFGSAPARFNGHSHRVNGVEVDCFTKDLQNIDVIYRRHDTSATPYHQTIDALTQLNYSTSITTIKISIIGITMDQIDKMKVILSKAEHVKIYSHDDENDGNLFDALLASCSNMKRLSLEGVLPSDNEHKWMQRIYPELELIEYIPKYCVRAEGPALKSFFELNTTIKQITIGAKILIGNRETFKNLNIKLDTLAIENGYPKYVRANLLNELHECGFYKKLHYHAYAIRQRDIDLLVGVRGLVKLHCHSTGYKDHVAVAALTNLEELCVTYSIRISDLKLLPDTLLKLKCIQFFEASSDDILPFVCRAAKMNKIEVETLLHGSHFNERDNVLNLLALNDEREKLVTARKITIYVNEDVYLATKWAMKQTDFSLIEIKRITSLNWKHSFTLDLIAFKI